MASIKVTQKRNNSTEISFAGGLTIYSVMEAYHQHFETFTFKQLVVFKLDKIEEIDTAGIQLITSIIKSLLEQGSQYQVSSTSEPVKEFSELFDLKFLMNYEVQSSLGVEYVS